MSLTVVNGPCVHEEPDVRYVVRHWNWKVYWKHMKAVDSRGRIWRIQVNPSGELLLNYCEGVTVNIEMPEIRDSYHSYLRSDFDVSKWVGPLKK